MAKPPLRRTQAKNQRNGQPVPVHLPVCLVGKVLQPRRLPQSRVDGNEFHGRRARDPDRDSEETPAIGTERALLTPLCRHARLSRASLEDPGKRFFPPLDSAEHAVLDIGCGHGEFINSVIAARKYAMDLNPAAKECLAAGICFFEQDCSAHWPLACGSLDAIFTSNFFEHLPTKAALRATLREAFR